MDFKTLRERIGNRPVVLDENMLYSNIKQFLDANNIPWRQFRKGMTDEDIMRHLNPNEVVITADRRFAYALQERGILVPLAKTHYDQMQHLLHSIGRRGGDGFNDIATCPICTRQQPTDEFSFWDIHHMRRHILRPHVAVSHRK